MRLILIGPPGSGKGTQAKLLAERLALAHISTGDILREAIDTGTPAGKKAAPFMTQGRLVPDEVVNEIISDRFKRPDRPERFVMDGYPRTSAQAAAFDGILKQNHLPLDAVLILLVNIDELVRRITGRWNCPKCKASFHVPDRPPRLAGICDDCGTKLVQRNDDQESTFRERERIYEANLKELESFYDRQGLARRVAGTGQITTIFQTIIQALPRANQPVAHS